MELEQLVSFVRYQRGQKQGWDTLDEVLTVVLESKERVDKAEATVRACEKKVEGYKQAEADLEKAHAVKLQKLDAQLADHKVEVERGYDKTLVDRKAALGILESKAMELESSVSVLEASSVVLTKEIADLQALKVTLERDVTKVTKQIAEIKASL